MDFTILYEKYRNLIIECNSSKSYTINNIIIGHGGSDNVIVELRIRKNYFIIKIFPRYILSNTKITPDFNEIEIKMYQFFTQKFILKNRTPHIVGIYNKQTCQKIDKMIKFIASKRIKCPTFEEKLLKHNKQMSFVDEHICDILLRTELKMIEPDFDMILLEYCEESLEDFFHDTISYLSETQVIKEKEQIMDFILDHIKRIIFQIIFTIAIIKDDYPGFLHGDLFARNIMLKYIYETDSKYYVAYHYKQKIWFIPVEGAYSKIIDFGHSIIIDELVSNVYKDLKHENAYFHYNPFNHKIDIYDFLYSIYSFLISSIKEYKISDRYSTPIYKLLSKFMDIRLINRIMKHNKDILDSNWYIDGIRVLEKTVQTPEEYLMGNTFKEYQNLPNNGEIVKHFNEPK
uniref:Protein kinase domain-containing protein n=1 Tax=viral metagenome TaxID=1070528 RepID=A0A6C0LTI6_9ZZZZ